MNGKPKVALYWCASCGGCEEAVVDLGAKILDLVAAVDIVFWPVAIDFKRRHIEALADGAIQLTFLNGAIRTSEQEEMAHLFRRKSQRLVAFGSCAHMGGIPGLANLSTRSGMLAAVYGEGSIPANEFRDNGHALSLPVLHEAVLALDQVVEVDYYVPGCPPTPKVIELAFDALLSGDPPPKGTVLAPDRALCEECSRKDTRPEKLTLRRFHRPHQVLIDRQTCLLAQGLVCLGPATRGGCEALCVKGNMPCTGCFGPTSRVRDCGGKALGSFASIIDCNDEAEIARAIETIPDPAGTFYRYSLPSSLLRGRIRHG